MSSQRRVVLITGGSRGLGRAAAIALARRQHDVVITFRDHADAAHAVVEQLESMGSRAAACPLDVADCHSFASFTEQFRGLLRSRWSRSDFDALLNNAGHGLNRPFVETQETEFDAIMAVHVKGPFFLTQALLPLLRDGGRILNVSSGLSRFCLPGHAAYGAAKGAVDVLTRYLARELGPRGISVNAIAPGAIETDFGGGAVRDNAEVNAQVAAMTAMGRAGRPDDIGAIMAQLLGPESQWVTGGRIEASGGMML
ncbi:MAG: SDR family oxidoreductase [Pseudomonadota bacterium]|nr:SDR family oxidoreductase [Pseudomonadota bacterium]